MKCSECGAELTGADKFCSNCGAAAAAPETPESALPTPEPPIDDDSQLEEMEPAAQDAEPEIESLLPPEQEPSDLPAAETLPEPPPVVKATGKRNTGLIIAIVVLVIVLLCCCCAIGVIVVNFEEISTALEAYQYQ